MSRPFPSLPLVALAGALALAGCNQAPKTTDNAMVDVGNAADLSDSAFNDAAPVVENSADSDTAAVTVVAVPKPAASIPAADRAPLVEASDIEDAIRSDHGVERIRYGDGWAWRRNGEIVRTADRDGHDVAYFRHGESTPFFVQRGGDAYAYRGGRPARFYGHDGKVTAPDSDRTREARQAEDDARKQRQQAEEARRRAEAGGGADHHGPAPAPSPAPDAHPGHHGNGDRPGRRPDATPTPTPEPSPSPSGRWRRPHRTPGDRTGN